MQTPKNMNVQAEQSVPVPSTCNIFLLHSSRYRVSNCFGVEEVELAEAMCSGVPSPRLSPFVFLSRAPLGTVGPYTTRVGGAGMDTYLSHLCNTTPFQVCGSSGSALYGNR